MKICIGGVEVWLHTFLTLTLGGEKPLIIKHAIGHHPEPVSSTSHPHSLLP